MTAVKVIPVSADSKPIVFEHDGRAMASSLDVAEFFGKRHDNVLARIRKLDCSPEFDRLNFKAISYIDAQNRVQEAVEMTKDGFAFLVMGFTGKEAARFKEQYIAAFNAMEAELRLKVFDQNRLARQIAAIVDDKVSRQVGVLLPQMVRAEIASGILCRRGKTAGQIWRENRFPPIKNIAAWFGNRLEKMGCRAEGNAYAEMGETKARLFDPDKAKCWLDNGGRHIVSQKIAERRGQGRLRLVLDKDAA